VGGAETDRSLRSTFVSTTGGVMTDEVGAITGELELLTRVTPDGGIGAMVSYAGGQDSTPFREAPCAAFRSVPTRRSTTPPTSASWRR
jgi:hypothetical protein